MEITVEADRHINLHCNLGVSELIQKRLGKIWVSLAGQLIF